MYLFLDIPTIGNDISVKGVVNLKITDKSELQEKARNVRKGIIDFASVDPNIITFHYEACKNKEEVFEMINLIKDNHCKVRNINKT